MRIRLILCVSCLAMSGCGSVPGQLKLVPAAGVVKYGDAPVADADVVFYPEKGPVGLGKTDAKGAFSIKTNGQSGGIPGKNKVTVVSKQEAAIPPSDGRAMEFAVKSTLPKKYTSQTSSDLVVEILNTGSNDLKLDLKD